MKKEFNKILQSIIHIDIQKYLSNQFEEDKPFRIVKNNKYLFDGTTFVIHNRKVYFLDDKNDKLVAKTIDNAHNCSLVSYLPHFLYPSEDEYIDYIDLS